jgi:NADH-quinone oxidoreductase subunit J
MLMNLNKENEVQPRITRLGAVVSLLDNCRFILVFINSKPIIGEYISWKDYQSIKVLGKVLLNEYMVPFEFASVLLLVAMIGTVYCLKEKNREIT